MHFLRIPNGIRTRATAVKGRGPRPLDDGDPTDGSPRYAAGSARIRRGLGKHTRLVAERQNESPGPGPRPDPVRVPGRDDALERDAEAFGAGRTMSFHLQLPGRVGVGVHGEEAADLQGQLDE